MWGFEDRLPRPIPSSWKSPTLQRVGCCGRTTPFGACLKLLSLSRRCTEASRIAFNTRSRASKLGLDRIAKQKRLEKELARGPMAAVSLDADPMADAPKPSMQQIEASKGSEE